MSWLERKNIINHKTAMPHVEKSSPLFAQDSSCRLGVRHGNFHLVVLVPSMQVSAGHPIRKRAFSNQMSNHGKSHGFLDDSPRVLPSQKFGGISIKMSSPFPAASQGSASIHLGKL